MKPILQLGNPILRQICEPIKEINSPQSQNVINNLLETLSQVGGVGIAAPQLGYLDRIVVIRPKPTKARPHLIDQGSIIMINPQVEIINNETIRDREGCLSIPKAEVESIIYGKVPRYTSIKITYQDEKGEYKSEIYHDFISRIIQHEVDHLNGILFIDTVDVKSLCSYQEYLKQIQLTASNI